MVYLSMLQGIDTQMIVQTKEYYYWGQILVSSSNAGNVGLFSSD